MKGLLSIINNTARPSLAKRLAAILYDSLLLAGVLMLMTLPFVLIVGSGQQKPFTHAVFQIYLLSVSFGFFAWSWTHGGQTLGMRAWRLRLIRRDGASLSWRIAAARFACAGLSWLCLGLGFIWILLDKDRQAWHDRLTGTEIIVMPKVGSPNNQ